uniref:Uncharacterized protein n=1 Tax=Ciona savignyi TaxID=51511 RepID=H2ZD43_CIOSA
MQHFIPTEDLSYFKTFLHQNNIACHLEIEEDNGWWSKSDSRTVSENEDRTTEISSNSDPTPLTPTTSEDDWSSVVPKVGFVTIDSDDGNTTLTKTNTGLIEGGDTQCEQESSFIFPSSKIKLPTFKNKRKGKPPSPLEFGAPYPDPAVGTDDDIHADDKDSIEKSLSEPESICASPRPPEHRKNKKHKHFRRGTKM